MLLLIGFVLYAHTLSSSFHFDDWHVIVNNPAIRDPGNLKAIWSVFNTRFVAGLTYAFNYALGRLNPFWYHLFNIISHILSSLLVHSLILLTFQTPRMKGNSLVVRKRPVAFFAALLFLVHPLQTQAVNYLWQRTASLAAFFYLCAMTSYVRTRLARTSSWGYLIAFFAAFLGLLTKETTGTLPVMLLLYEFCFFESWKENGRRRLLFLLPFLVTPCMIPILLRNAGPNLLSLLRHEGSDYAMSHREYLWTEFNVMRTYLRLLWFPVRQNVDYDYPIAHRFFEPGTVLSFLLLAAIGLVSLKTFRRQPLLSFGILWFFLTLSVESSFIRLRDVIFEHRLYLPMAGFAIFLPTALTLLLKDRRKFIALSLVILLTFSIATYRRNSIWKDEITLWQDTVRKSPGKARAHFALGVAYGEKRDLDKAIASYEKALQLNPAYVEAYNNLGAAYGSRGDYQRAIKEFRKSLQMDPGYEEARTHLKRAYDLAGLNQGIEGNYNKAIAYFEKSLRLKSDAPEVYCNLGTTHARKGDFDKAIRSYEKAIALKPTYIEAHVNLGIAYLQRRNKEGVLRQVERLRALHRDDLADPLEKRGGRLH